MDQTLESAFKVSCVWCYQEIARLVGSERYVSSLAINDYGNQQVGDQVDQFWLNGDLRISAIEQVGFLKRLHDYALPYRREYVDIVKEIMLDESGIDYAIYAKSGWTGSSLHVGWYVGYVEKGDKTWLFAMNMRMDRADQGALRKALVVRSLRALGII
jgi:beta-lactamase class D